MTDVPIEFLKCPSGKMKFVCSGDARKYLKGGFRKNKPSGKGYVYHCPMCDAWHITSVSRSNYRKLRR